MKRDKDNTCYVIKKKIDNNEKIDNDNKELFYFILFF